MTLLWLIGLDHVSGMRHGGNLRWFNLSRELLARGHRVYFAINRAGDTHVADRTSYLERLERDGFISGSFVLDYPHRQVRTRWAQLMGYHPRALSQALRGPRETVVREISTLVEEQRADALLVSDRAFLFLTEAFAGRLPVLVDWVDSFVLYFVRSLGMHLRGGQARAALADLRTLVPYVFQERYYGRRAALSLLASPVDKRCFDRVTGRPRLSRALVNGLSIAEPAPAPSRSTTRVIFTGNMDFPPNYQAALWFIDRVLPLVHERKPDVAFAVAGRNPVPELLRRAGPTVEILGDVQDIPAEISRSALYVAPLISGGGFKNKVIEAITCGTFVVSTSRGVEFLEPRLRDLLLVADTPAAFAAHVLAFLDRPERFSRRLPELRNRVAEEYTWSRRAEELIAHLSPALVAAELDRA